VYNTNAGAAHAAARQRGLLAEAARDRRLALARDAKTLPARVTVGRVLRFWTSPDAAEPIAA